MDLEYSYDATTDVHSFNPSHDDVIEEVDGSVKSTLVVKNVNGIVTIPINSPLVESKTIFELHNAETQTDELVDGARIGQACREYREGEHYHADGHIRDSSEH